MSDDSRLPYAVRRERKNGVVTFRCPTAEWALRKLADFEKSGYAKIIVIGPNGPLTEADLRQLVEGPPITEGGAPVDLDAPSAPELVA